MDLQLIRSFVEVSESGSFAAASERLFVTQSAVSLRIQRLEDHLGRALFHRSKDGVTLTAAGRAFRPAALQLLAQWEQARQRVAGILETQPVLGLGAEAAIWQGFGFEWLEALGAALPMISLEAEDARGEGLAALLQAGRVQFGLSYEPIQRAGLRCEKLGEIDMVMVSPWPDLALADLVEQGADARQYWFVQWSSAFAAAHEAALPMLQVRALARGLGGLVRDLIAHQPGATYMPDTLFTNQHLVVGAGLRSQPGDSSGLHKVANAPVLPQVIWGIWREDIGADLLVVAQRTLSKWLARANQG